MDYANRSDYKYFHFGDDVKTPSNATDEGLWKPILDGVCTLNSLGKYTTCDGQDLITVELHTGCASVTRNGKTTVHHDQLSLLRVISYRVYYLDSNWKGSPRQIYVPLGTLPQIVWYTLGHIYNYPFYGTVFCYTNDTEGFMMFPSRARGNGPNYTVSAIESDL